MTIKIELQVGKKKYKLYDFEAAQLYNKLRNYFENVGAFDAGGNLQDLENDAVAEQREIGFKREK